MTQEQTIGELNVVVRMMTEGFQRGIAQIERSLGKMEDTAAKASDDIDAMMDAAARSTEGMTDAVNGVTEEVEELTEEVEELTDEMDGMASVGESIGGTIGTTLDKMSPKFGKFRKAIEAVTGEFTKMGNKSKLAVMVAGGAVATIAAGFVFNIGKAMYEKMGELVAVANPEVYLRATERLSASLTRLKASIGTVLAPVFDALSLAIQGAIEAMVWWSKNVLAPVYGFMSGLFNATDYIDTYSTASNDIADASGTIADNVEEMGRGLAGFDKLDVQSGLSDAKNTTALTAEAKADMEEIIARMREGADAGLRMNESIVSGVETIRSNLSPVIDKVRELWQGFTEWIDSSGIADFVNGLGGRIQDIFDGITSSFRILGTNISKIPEATKQALSGVLQMWSNLFSGIGGMFTSLWNGIAQIPTKFGEALTGVVRMWENLVGGIGDLMSSISGPVNAIRDAFASVLADVLRSWSDLFAGIGGMFDPVVTFFRDAIVVIDRMWVNLGNDIQRIFLIEIDWNAITNQVVSAFDGMVEQIANAYNVLGQFIPGMAVVPIDRLRAEIMNVGEVTQASFEEISNSAEEASSRITAGLNDATQAADGLSASINEASASAGRLADRATASTERIADGIGLLDPRFSSVGQSADDAVTRIIDGVSSVEESVGGLGNTTDELVSSVAGGAEEFSGSADTLIRASQTASDAIALIAQTTASAVTGSTVSTAMSAEDAIARITEGVTDIDVQFNDLSDTTEQVWQHNTDSALESFSTISGEIGAVSDALSGMDASLDTSGTVDAIDGIHEEVSSMFDSINDGMHGTADSARDVADAISEIAENMNAVTTPMEDAASEMAIETPVEEPKKSAADWYENAKAEQAKSSATTSKLGALGSLFKGFKKMFGLANGGVVDPDNPMLAVIGDNKREKEAVAPLSSLQSMIDESVSKAMASNGYGGKGAAQDITLEIDGRELARVTYDYMASESKRRGATIARTA